MKPVLRFIIIVFVLTVKSVRTINLGIANPSEVTLFEDGFEENVPMEMAYNGSLPLSAPTTPTGWTTNDIDASLYENGTILGPARAWIVQDATEAHHGEFSAKFWTGPAKDDFGVGTGRYSLLMKRWWDDPSTPHEFTEFYVRWYQKFETLPTTQGKEFNAFYMLAVQYSDDYSTIVNIYIENAMVKIRMEDTLKIAFYKLWNNGSTFGAGKTPVNLTTNKWYCFEVWYKSDPINGEYKLWLDGDELFSVTGINSTPPARLSHPNGFDLGLMHYDTDESTNYTAWIDCVVAADYRVGPEGWMPPDTVDVTIQVFNNETKNYVPNAFVKMDSYEGYTNESGFIIFTEIPSFSSYTLTISKSGYQTFMESVSISDTNLNLQFYLIPIASGKGSLKVSAYRGGQSVAASVEVVIDDITIGSYITPFTIDLDTGTYQLRVHYENQKLSKTVDILEGQTVFIKIEFPVETGIFEIQAYADSTEIALVVEISNSSGVVATVETPYSVELSPGTYILNATYNGQTITKTETLLEGQTKSITFQFEGKDEGENEKGVLQYDIETITLTFLLIALIVGAIIAIKESKIS